MTRGLAIALCAASAAGAAWAQTPQPRPAPPLSETFKRACWETRGDYARMIADPEVRTWKRVPVPMPSLKGMKLSQKSIRVKSFEKGVVRMFVGGTGEILLSGRPAKIDLCAIQAKPGDFQATVGQVQALLGQAPAAGEKGAMSFRFLEAGGRRTPVAQGKLSKALEGLGPGEVITIDVIPEGRSTSINYARIQR